MIGVNDVNLQSSCIITNSTFTHNTADFYNPMGVVNITLKEGISVTFSDNAARNTVQLDGVRIENNSGSGVVLTFADKTNGNNVTIDGADVIGNTGYIGGGVFIQIADVSPFGNTVTITNSRFIANVANIGGGVAVEAEINSFVSPSNNLLIENCVFDNNYAVHGSVLYQSNEIEQHTTIHNSTILPQHGVPINNPYFIHVEVTSLDLVVLTFIRTECTWKGWVLFLSLQLVLLWIVLILLAALHIKITDGGLNGYILYSHATGVTAIYWSGVFKLGA